MTVTLLHMANKPKVPRRSRTYRLPEKLLALLESLAESNRRPVTSEVEIALEEHLKRNKLWPPAAAK